MQRRAEQRKYHYIYKITRDDGRYYIGMHSTDNLEDGYFGSGKKITRSIKKYGIERHKKEILEFLPSREALRTREEQLVNEEVVKDPLCMNIATGGHPSGFFSDVHRAAFVGSSRTTKLKGTEQAKAINRAAVKTKRERGYKPVPPSFTGLTHSQETKEKMSHAMKGRFKGKNNSQFGSCWVTDGKKPIKIKNSELSEYLKLGFSRGRKLVT